MQTKKPGAEWKTQPFREYRFEAKAELDEYVRHMREDNGYTVSQHDSSFVFHHNDEVVEFARITSV